MRGIREINWLFTAGYPLPPRKPEKLHNTEAVQTPSASRATCTPAVTRVELMSGSIDENRSSNCQEFDGFNVVDNASPTIDTTHL